MCHVGNSLMDEVKMGPAKQQYPKRSIFCTNFTLLRCAPLRFFAFVANINSMFIPAICEQSMFRLTAEAVPTK